MNTQNINSLIWMFTFLVFSSYSQSVIPVLDSKIEGMFFADSTKISNGNVKIDFYSGNKVDLKRHLGYDLIDSLGNYIEYTRKVGCNEVYECGYSFSRDFYSSGNTKLISIHFDDNLIVTYRFYENGRIETVENYNSDLLLNGWYFYYDEKGNIIEKHFYVNGH